jgi:hypothetical protein
MTSSRAGRRPRRPSHKQITARFASKDLLLNSAITAIFKPTKPLISLHGAP